MSKGVFFNYATRLLREEKRSRAQWARELSVSERTITNFNKRLKDEFGIVVESAKKHKYYFINKQKSSRYEAFINFIQNLNSPTKIAETIQGRDDIAMHLIFHQRWNSVDWMRYFNMLLTAVNEQRYVTIKHISFRTEESHELMYFMPYWMKQNAYFRWYVIGFENETSKYPTVLGLDKIVSLTIDDHSFDRKPSLEHFREQYENQFGIYVYHDRQPETVRIECTRFQAKYLKSLPLHPSQEIESEDEKVTIFRFRLIINHEFAYELLRQNAWNFMERTYKYAHPKQTAIKVLEPAWLVEYFHQTYLRSYYAYCNNPEIKGILKQLIDNAEYPFPLPEF